MNATRLREIIDLLLQKEQKYQVQENLRQLSQKLTELVSDPQNTGRQNEFSQALEKLAGASADLRASIDPAQIPPLEEIGADKFFLHDFLAEIRTSIRDNPLSPVVAQQKLNQYTGERENYVQQISQLQTNLKALHIEASTLEPGDAEIGFLLPRGLFNNRLDQLIKELRDLNRIMRAFSEAATGTVEAIELRNISTTDPLFFFHLSPTTIAAIGAAITWALATWKQVEEIRRVRAETRKTEVLTEKEATDLFDKKIEEKIRTAIDAKAKELIKDDAKPGRPQEQRTDLAWALESILAHVERGMIVEIRFIPPAPDQSGRDGATAAAQPPAEAAAFETLQKITPQLMFPKMEGTPVLKLPQPPTADPRE